MSVIMLATNVVVVMVVMVVVVVSCDIYSVHGKSRGDSGGSGESCWSKLT